MTDIESLTAVLRDARRYRALRGLVSVGRDYCDDLLFAVPQHLLRPAAYPAVDDMPAELDRALDKLGAA